MKKKAQKTVIAITIIVAVILLSVYVYMGYKAAQRRNAAIKKWIEFYKYIDPETGEIDTDSVPADLQDKLKKYENSEKIAAGESVHDWVNGFIWWYKNKDFKNPFTKLFITKATLKAPETSENEEE